MARLKELQTKLFDKHAAEHDVVTLKVEIERRGIAKKKPVAEREVFADLPAALIGSVYSINVRFQTWHNVVHRFDEATGWNLWAAEDESRSLTHLCRRMSDKTDLWCAKHLFGNTQLTSPRSGILKAAAVRLFAKALVAEGIN